MTEDVTQASRICPECGTKRPVNATACPTCGTLVRSPRVTTSGEEADSEDADIEHPANGIDRPPPRAVVRSVERRTNAEGHRTSGAFLAPRPPEPNFESPPSRWRSMLGRLKHLNALGALRRLVSLAALVVILVAVAYAILPFNIGKGPTRANCSPAIVQVFDRQRLTPPATPGGQPGPPITSAPPPAPGQTATPAIKGVLKPCTKQAQRRLYYAGPIVILALIASAGARNILS